MHSCHFINIIVTYMRGLYTMSSRCLYWDPQIMWSVWYCWRKVHRCFSLPFFFKFSRGQKASVFGRVTSVKIRVDLALKTQLCMSCTCMLSNNFPCTLLLEVLTIKLFNKPVSLPLKALIWFWSFAERYCPYPASQLCCLWFTWVFSCSVARGNYPNIGVFLFFIEQLALKSKLSLQPLL